MMTVIMHAMGIHEYGSRCSKSMKDFLTYENIPRDPMEKAIISWEDENKVLGKNF